ncbi:MAG TPA: proprotein convertase P-domain-containing protein, partial [Flavobacteriales bacterium]|nr:proprotein convertase P-domain-containing protein [Flavobacteriales bacterium]
MNIEHSWLGDLVMTITSPSGESVILHQQGVPQETLLGDPVDSDEANPIPGDCEQYCFANASANGSMAAYANANNGAFGYTLPPGTYQSLYPLTGLLGSQLNGVWTLTICDMWAQDNGFLCDWNIDFDPSLYANVVEFTPVYGAACDSTWWTGPGIVSTANGCENICVQNAAAGTYDYVYHAVDNWGCSYDTTLSITVAPPIVVDAGANATICNGGNVQLNAAVISGGLPPPPCDYTLELLDSFGDGWDGASLTVVINGVSTNWTLPGGSGGTAPITVNTGDIIQLIYNPSILFNGEHSYTLYNSTGGVAFTDTPPMTNGLAWSGVANCGPAATFIYSWSPTTGLNNPNIANPIATPGSTTTYTVTVSQVGHPGCTGTDQITITIGSGVDAGTDAVVTVCSNAAAFQLFSQLGGAPNAGGAWTGPGGAINGTFTPGPSTPGVLPYTVNGGNPCPGSDGST